MMLPLNIHRNVLLNKDFMLLPHVWIIKCTEMKQFFPYKIETKICNSCKAFVIQTDNKGKWILFLLPFKTFIQFDVYYLSVQNMRGCRSRFPFYFLMMGVEWERRRAKQTKANWLIFMLWKSFFIKRDFSTLVILNLCSWICCKLPGEMIVIIFTFPCDVWYFVNHADEFTSNTTFSQIRVSVKSFSYNKM